MKPFFRYEKGREGGGVKEYRPPVNSSEFLVLIYVNDLNESFFHKFTSTSKKEMQSYAFNRPLTGMPLGINTVHMQIAGILAHL